MALNLASLNQRYNYLLSLINSIISGIIPVPTSSTLAVVLTNGNNAGSSNINMNGQDLQNLKTVNSQNNQNLTVDGQGTAHIIMKTAGINRVTVNDTGIINVHGHTIQNSSLIDSQNNQNLTVEGRGTGSVILKSNNVNRLTVASNGIVTIPGQIITPTVQSSGILYLDGTSIQMSTGTVQRIGIASNGTTTFFNPIIMSANQNITQSGTLTNTFGATSLLANTNLSFPTGTGIISQSITNATDTNMLKRTNIEINGGTAAGTPNSGFTVTDNTSGADNRGFLVAPNCSLGAFNNTVEAGDTAICSRNAGGNSSALVLTTHSPNRCGIRLNSKVSTAPNIGIILGASGSISTTLYETTKTIFDKPIELRYAVTNPSGMAQLGGQVVTTMTDVTVATDANIRGITTYTFAIPGTYLINWNVKVTMSSGTATFSAFAVGIANTAATTFNVGTFTYTSYLDLINVNPTLSSTQTINRPTSCVYKSTAANEIAYFNYIATYTGGTDIIFGGMYTVTRIG